MDTMKVADKTYLPLGEVKLTVGIGNTSTIVTAVHIRSKPKYLPAFIWHRLIRLAITS